MTPDALEELPTSAQEISELLSRYRVAMADAQLPQQSDDGRYVDAYTAGFLLAKIVVRASGYRVKSGENHRDTFSALPWLMGSPAQGFADAMDAARKRRNADLYDAAGLVDQADVQALLNRITRFEMVLGAWLDEKHPELTL